MDRAFSPCIYLLKGILDIAKSSLGFPSAVRRRRCRGLGTVEDVIVAPAKPACWCSQVEGSARSAPGGCHSRYALVKRHWFGHQPRGESLWAHTDVPESQPRISHAVFTRPRIPRSRDRSQRANRARPAPDHHFAGHDARCLVESNIALSRTDPFNDPFKGKRYFDFLEPSPAARARIAAKQRWGTGPSAPN